MTSAKVSSMSQCSSDNIEHCPFVIRIVLWREIEDHLLVGEVLLQLPRLLS